MQHYKHQFIKMDGQRKIKNPEKLCKVANIFKAYKNLQPVVTKTPITRSDFLSRKYNANIFLKREDLQIVRSFKLRGAYNKFLTLTPEQKKVGVVCASAGNHGKI